MCHRIARGLAKMPPGLGRSQKDCKAASEDRTGVLTARSGADGTRAPLKPWAALRCGPTWARTSVLASEGRPAGGAGERPVAHAQALSSHSGVASLQFPEGSLHSGLCGVDNRK